MRLMLFTWHRFSARIKRNVLSGFMEDVAKESEKAFKKGIRRTGRFPPASAPGEYPARRSGRHYATIDSEHTDRSATVGSGMFYAKFLREGTRKMARRAMSDNALQEGAEKASRRLKRWVEWTRT